jgi:hypothetical protein
LLRETHYYPVNPWREERFCVGWDLMEKESLDYDPAIALLLEVTNSGKVCTAKL